MSNKTELILLLIFDKTSCRICSFRNPQITDQSSFFWRRFLSNVDNVPTCHLLKNDILTVAPFYNALFKYSIYLQSGGLERERVAVLRYSHNTLMFMLLLSVTFSPHNARYSFVVSFLYFFCYCFARKYSWNDCLFKRIGKDEKILKAFNAKMNTRQRDSFIWTL